MIEELHVVLPEKSKTTSVRYADAPLKSGVTPREITIEELNKKISQPFTYSNALYSKDKVHLLDYDKSSNPEVHLEKTIQEKFEQQEFTDVSSFVICNMGDLGHGLFADRDFEPGECFMQYSGVILNNSQLKKNEDYLFGINKDLTLSIDASEVGNISRFLQHMPLNFDSFEKNIRDYKAFSSQYDKESLDFWEWRNLVYKAGLAETDVAWANLMITIISIKNIPYVVFYNTRKINKGEQLGITYGGGYWIRRKIRPALFNAKGDVIPPDQYGYKEVVVTLPCIELLNKFLGFEKIGITKSYTAVMFQKDLQRKESLLQPVYFSHMAEPVSIFELRELLLEFNVIGKEYEAIENAFLSELRNILPEEFKIKMYVRDPQQKSTRPIYDVVCTTDDLMKWSQITNFIKNPHLIATIGNIPNKCLKLTQEVIFMDRDSINQMHLLSILKAAKNKGIFTTPLEPEYIPSGPERRLPNSIIKVQRGEEFDQILFHNPGLTKEDIGNFYNAIESIFDPSIKPNKDVKLNFSTFSFFQFNPPAKWNVYPSDKLTGKYIGHQVRFFNIPVAHSAKAQPFADKLRRDGFEAELKKSAEKPSIVVDLTVSRIS